jgi:cytidine deaminase
MTVLSQAERLALLAAARDAALHAYCPYSRFPVGAAVLTDRGEIYSGCNVENASYGLTVCAERNAVFQAVARGSGPLRIQAMIIYAPAKSPAAPCGACRQVLYEFGREAIVLCVGTGSDIIETSLAELLPRAFGPDHLNR